MYIISKRSKTVFALLLCLFFVYFIQRWTNLPGKYHAACSGGVKAWCFFISLGNILRCERTLTFCILWLSGLRPPERAVLQVRVEREAAGASQGHGASGLAHVYNPRLLRPVQYPFRLSRSLLPDKLWACSFYLCVFQLLWYVCFHGFEDTLFKRCKKLPRLCLGMTCLRWRL